MVSGSRGRWRMRNGGTGMRQERALTEEPVEESVDGGNAHDHARRDGE